MLHKKFALISKVGKRSGQIRGQTASTTRFKQKSTRQHSFCKFLSQYRRNVQSFLYFTVKAMRGLFRFAWKGRNWSGRRRKATWGKMLTPPPRQKTSRLKQGPKSGLKPSEYYQQKLCSLWEFRWNWYESTFVQIRPILIGSDFVPWLEVLLALAPSTVLG